jgi:hypothetical protein
MTTTAAVGSVEQTRTYRIGDQEWCTAIVQWHLAGLVLSALAPKGAWGGATWTTSVLFTPNTDDPRLTILRDAPPRPLDYEAFEAMELPSEMATALETVMMGFTRAAYATVRRSQGLHPLRGQRAYEGALARDVAAVRIGDTSVG